MTTPDAHLLECFRRAVHAKIERDLATEEAVARSLRARVIPALERAVARARDEGLCGEAWLFGSFAWGKPTESSDVDMLVDRCPDTDAFAARLEAATDKLVHVQERGAAPAGLVERALSEGVPL